MPPIPHWINPSSCLIVNWSRRCILLINSEVNSFMSSLLVFLCLIFLCQRKNALEERVCMTCVEEPTFLLETLSCSAYKEVDEGKKCTAQLRETINTYMSQATSTEEEYVHIVEKDRQSVIEKVAMIQKWLEDQTVRQSERAEDVELVLTN